MGAIGSFYEVNGIPTKQEEEERCYIFSIIFATLTVVEALSSMT